MRKRWNRQGVCEVHGSSRRWPWACWRACWRAAVLAGVAVLRCAVMGGESGCERWVSGCAVAGESRRGEVKRSTPDKYSHVEPEAAKHVCEEEEVEDHLANTHEREVEVEADLDCRDVLINLRTAAHVGWWSAQVLNGGRAASRCHVCAAVVAQQKGSREGRHIATERHRESVCPSVSRCACSRAVLAACRRGALLANVQVPAPGGRE